MHADARKLLWDARHAAERIARFTAGKTFTEYEADEYLRSAVERQFEIVGEAMNQLRRVEDLARRGLLFLITMRRGGRELGQGEAIDSLTPAP